MQSSWRHDGSHPLLIFLIFVFLSDCNFHLFVKHFGQHWPELLFPSLKTSPLVPITYLSQFAENNLEVFLLVHLPSDWIQVVFNSGGTEAAVELVYVVIVEGERLIADGHLGDRSYSALVFYKTGKTNSLNSKLLKKKQAEQIGEGDSPIDLFDFILMDFLISFFSLLLFCLSTPFVFMTFRKYLKNPCFVFCSQK